MKGKNSRRNEPRRTQWIHIRLTPDEVGKINDRFREKTYKDLSTYLRKAVLDKPVTVVTRNQSLIGT